MSATVPVSSPLSTPAGNSAPPRRRAWVSALILIAKLTYALSAGAFAVWIVSFTPVRGPELTQFVPMRTGVAIHIRSGARVLTNLAENTALQELLDDPDFSRLYTQLKEQRKGTSANTATSEASSPGEADKIQSIPAQLRLDYDDALERTPKFVRARLKRLFPPEIASVFPLAGQEIIVARVVPELSPAHDATKQKAPPQTLLITRVSGGAGMLARLLGHFSKNQRARFYDLGGDAIAIGFNGAAPGLRTTPLEQGLPPSSTAVSDGPWSEPFARITIFPPILEGKLTAQSDLKETPLGPYLQAFAESVLKSLLRAPTASDMLGLSETPREIRIDLFETRGGIAARGEIDGGVPALPAGIPDPSTAQRIEADSTGNRTPYLEGVLPVNMQACYLFAVANELRTEKEKDAAAGPLPKNEIADFTHRPRGLTKSQWKCIEHIGFLQDRDIDLDRDLFPALGKAVHFRMDDPPPDLSPTGYGLLRAAMGFDGKNEAARIAARELTHSGWDMFDFAPGKGAHTPYVRYFQSADRDCYVLATGEIFAPSWCVAQDNLSLTSDAGSFALIRNGPKVLPPPPILPPQPTSYFLKLNGRRIAPSVETFESNRYSDLEKEIGSQAFLAKYPNAELHYALARKLCGLLGELHIEVTPTGSGNGALKIEWKPGSVNVPSVKRETAPPGHSDAPKENDSSPPPPVPDDTPAPPPPPPPDDEEKGRK